MRIRPVCLVWLTLLLLMFVPAPGTAQDDDLFKPAGAAARPSRTDRVEAATLKVEPTGAARGQLVTLKLTLKLVDGYHTYPTEAVQTDPNATAYVTRLQVLEAAGLEVGKARDPASYLSKAEPELNVKEMRYYEGEVTWEWPLRVPEDAQPGEKLLKAQVDTQVCDDKGCLPYSKTLETTLTVTDAPVMMGTALPPDDPPAAKKSGSTDLLSFILQGVLWGVITLFTPCVFPMIPITVSFFLKQSEKEHHKPFAVALVYSGTIVVVLTIAAVLLLKSFQAASQHWAMNLALGLLFVIFALSLFGMFEIRLPSSLATMTSSQEGRGGLLGTMFMALTFTIISFTCVAPFLGTFAGLTATATTGGDWLKLILGGLAFSVTFAAPFFLLALFPPLLRLLPKSGAWMETMKVVMGFLELAAALKFLRAAELLMTDETLLFTYDLVLGSYVALSLICGVYLLGLFRLPHDVPVEHIGVMRFLFSLAFIGLGLYLLPGLFRQSPEERIRPAGAVFAWLDSFVLPDAHGNLPWIGNLEKGLAQAKQENRRVFIDFTGET